MNPSSDQKSGAPLTKQTPETNDKAPGEGFVLSGRVLIRSAGAEAPHTWQDPTE